MYIFIATWWKVSLADFLSSFYFAHFYRQNFAPIGLQKTNPASGWLVQKISQRQILWFFNAHQRCNRKPTGRWEILLTQPVGMASKVLSRQLRLSSSRDGVPWAMVNLPAIQFILAVRLIPILTHLSSRWTVPLRIMRVECLWPNVTLLFLF